jgi:ribose 5-phosphate isomerase B
MAGPTAAWFLEARDRGEQIAANKVRGIRAALCHDLYTAQMSRQHNDANVLSMGARTTAPDQAREILERWLSEPFEGGRHERRIRQIEEIEREEAGSVGGEVRT